MRPIGQKLTLTSPTKHIWPSNLMTIPRLHLDADVSHRTLARVLIERGHDVTRTPCSWMPADASDVDQLLGATAQGRCILTFNIADFVHLAVRYPRHGGIILAQQRDWTLASLIAATDLMLQQTSAIDWPGTTRWLNEWRPA